MEIGAKNMIADDFSVSVGVDIRYARKANRYTVMQLWEHLFNSGRKSTSWRIRRKLMKRGWQVKNTRSRERRERAALDREIEIEEYVDAKLMESGLCPPCPGCHMLGGRSACRCGSEEPQAGPPRTVPCSSTL